MANLFVSMCTCMYANHTHNYRQVCENKSYLHIQLHIILTNQNFLVNYSIAGKFGEFALISIWQGNFGGWIGSARR